MTSSSRMPQVTTASEAVAASEEVFLAFEAAWRRGPPPAIDDYLTGKPGPELLLELVHLDLEYRLKSGEAQRVYGYLSRYPQLAADATAVRDLIVAEFQLRRRREPDLTVAEYVRRFPQFSHALEEWLARAQETIDPQATILESHAEGALWPNDLPGYHVVGELGKGGMGIVYEAVQLGLHRRVAIKMIRAGAGATPELLARFHVEAEALASLQHPNI